MKANVIIREGKLGAKGKADHATNENNVPVFEIDRCTSPPFVITSSCWSSSASPVFFHPRSRAAMAFVFPPRDA